MIQEKLAFLACGSARYDNLADYYVHFTMDHQLMKTETWENFVRVFQYDSDDCNQGWRGEYWGKMMRGACLIYQYNRDEKLYDVLDKTVREMLDAQRADGRFSTYSTEGQLHGWDLWSRKYILTSMLHFYRICKDEVLKTRILEALCRHADAIIAMVGDEEGKVDIRTTTNHWGGINSCSILDAMLDLYQETGEKRFFDFGTYIIQTGGCKDGNVIELALENKRMPYEYPVVKAYETISFFEGVLTYYQITGEEKYLQAVLNFVEAVNESDITVIGCCGCTHELFDHSALKQVVYSEGIMQETCVTVTWMRMMGRLLLLTGEEKYYARMEQSAYNALYGSVNEHGLRSYDPEDAVEPMPFDSYSPLYNQVRGKKIGGFQKFSFGGFYSCCTCIAAAGIAIFPLCSVLKGEDGLVINGFMPGMVTESTPGGQKLVLKTETAYPADGNWTGKLELEKPENFTLKIRIPAFYGNRVQLKVNGESVDVCTEESYVNLKRAWKNGDTVELSGKFGLQTVALEGKTAFTYGPLTMAWDADKETPMPDLTETVSLETKDGVPVYTVEEPDETCHELLRLKLARKDGKNPLLLTNYSACGKKWNKKSNRITVWLNVK